MSSRRQYSDQQLEAAIASATSWRATLRGLGLSATSSSAIRSVRAHADRLGIAYGHFTGVRTWNDADLEEAAVDAENWNVVVERLGLQGGSCVAVVRRHAARLGLDLPSPRSRAKEEHTHELVPALSNLHRAGPQLAAAWFTLCGLDVSCPLEPCRYDLVVEVGGRFRRVQVKTTTTRAGATWQVFLSTSGRDRKIYSPDEVDDFFIIDGDLHYYLIPIAEARGLHAIHLSAYATFRVEKQPTGHLG